MIFAKLFSTSDGNQILFTLDYDTDDEMYKLVFRTKLDDGVAITVSLLGKDEEAMRRVFDEQTPESAEEKYQFLKKGMTTPHKKKKPP